MNPLMHARHPIAAIGIACLLVLIGVVVSPKPASADPHATFYTATGQQQLFFNVLAALDQADYVEPATALEGAASDFSRSALLQSRADSGFSPEQDDRVISTQTQLAGVITRNITLEGHDLWTAYLAHQFALEAARRNGVDKVLRIFCERGLGLEDCDDTVHDSQAAQKNKEEAYVVNPIEHKEETTARGLAVLFSGTEGHEKEAKKILGGGGGTSANAAGGADSNQEKYLDEGPYTYDEEIASWWKKALDEDDEASPGKKKLATLTTSRVVRSLSEPVVDSSVWDFISADPDGNLGFNEDRVEEPEDLLAAHEYAMSGLITNQLALLDKATGAIKRVEAQTEETLSEGHEPDKEILHVPSTVDEEETGEISSRVTVPSSVKREVASAHATIGVLGTEQNLATAQAESEYDPAGKSINAVELVERFGNNDGGSGTVSGATTSSAPLGQVAHADHDPPPSADYNTKRSVDLSSPIVPFHFEKGGVHSLSAIGYGENEGGCGCSDMLPNSIGGFGQNIMDMIDQSN